MNSNPSFYPKHLARQYVHHRGWKEPDEAEELQVPPPASLHVPKINGQRSVTPVGNVSMPAAVTMTSNSTESSPSSSMNSTELSISSRDGSRSNRKILEGLPDTFITAMKQLFCLLDVEGCGQVHIEDIAENWSPDGAGAVLPPNIVPSLKKVTTPDGYLTFERFCAGLKIAILRHSAQRHRQIDSSEENSDHSEDAIASSISRTSSMPNLLDSSESDGEKKDGDHKMKLTSPSPAPSEPCFSLKSTTSQATQGPPKPPRDPSRVSSLDIRRNLPTTFAMKNVAGSTTSLPAFVHSRTLTNSITPKDTEFIWKAPPAPFVSQSNLYENPSAVPYSNSRRTAISQAPTDELSSLKYLEGLKTCLEETIPLVERTADWCKSRLINLTNLLNHDADLKMPININIKQLKELNSRMNTIMQTPSIEPLPKDEVINHELMRRIDRLQEQNRMLTTEVGRQSNRVTALEQDKRSLIKQLFQHSSSSNSLNSNASTLR